MNDRIKKYALLVGKISISTLVFVFVIRKVLQDQTIDFISMVSIPLLFVILITGVIQISINALIQKNLLAIYNFKFHYINILIHNFVSTMYLLLIPGFFAPDFYLGYYYGKKQKDYGRIISALFINRAIGLILFTLLAVLSIFLLGPKYIGNLTLEIEHKNLSITFMIISICFLLTLLGWFFFKEKIRKLFCKINNIWQETKNNEIRLWNAVLLKIGFNVVGVTGRILVGYLLGVNLPIWEFVCVILMVNFLIALPISLNGVGLREAGYVGMLTLLGVSESTAFVFALSEFGITVFSALIGASVFSVIKLNQVRLKINL
jgi:uncharacterized membrane protein YbhN (UPF0104 family)